MTPKNPTPAPEQLDALLDAAEEMTLAVNAWRRFAGEITECRRQLARLEQSRGAIISRLGASRQSFEASAEACGFDWEAALAAVATCPAVDAAALDATPLARRVA